MAVPLTATYLPTKASSALPPDFPQAPSVISNRSANIKLNNFFILKPSLSPKIDLKVYLIHSSTSN
ncbi:conserved domain protein [Streptococcus mitis bv. 2 str. F0392]|uniref:Conserved domain protein n=1 Tax=Streptococcus mitis bv. 2 str. F0392 TaxID=768726 RepID=F9P059_STROR|nr:conserved domain protein [Streptococcus mitis bv. 2 str. F0392]